MLCNAHDARTAVRAYGKTLFIDDGAPPCACCPDSKFVIILLFGISIIGI
jgi:hypothetical protein